MHTHTLGCCQGSSTRLNLIQKHPDTQLISCGLTSQTAPLIIRQLHNYTLCSGEWVMDRIASCYAYVSEGEPNPFPLGKCLPLDAWVLQGCSKLTSITQTDVNKQVTLNAQRQTGSLTVGWSVCMGEAELSWMHHIITLPRVIGKPTNIFRKLQKHTNISYPRVTISFLLKWTADKKTK